MSTTLSTEVMLYQAARIGWLNESHCPSPTADCPGPFDYHLLDGNRDEILAKVTEVVKIAAATKTWQELIEELMKVLPFDDTEILKLAGEYMLDREVVQATVAACLLEQARRDGLIEWGDIRLG